MKNMPFKFLTIITFFIAGFVINTTLFASGLDLLHDKTFTVNAGETLYLEGASGDVLVEVWDKNEVGVKIYGNEKAAERIDFTLEKIDSGVKVKAEKKGGSWFNWFSSIRLKFEVMVPAEFNNEIKTAGGDIKFSGVNGKNSLKTSGGDVEARDVKGLLEIKTSGGDIKIFTHTGETDLATSGGDIEVVDQNGDIDASTSGGDIKLDVKNGVVDGSTSGGDVILKYAGENRGIDLSTSGGDIKIAIPSDFSADVKLKTAGGDISNKFPNSKSDEIRRGRYTGKFNNGGKALECSTTGGDISVRTL